MRIGVIRGDLPQPVILSGLEPIVQHNPMVEPEGQDFYLGRPTVANVTAALATVPASIESPSDIGILPVLVNGGNQTLKLRRADSGAYTTILVATGSYATVGDLLAAINTALDSSGFPAVADFGSTDLRVMLRSTEDFGPGATLETDSVAGGSTFNGPAAFGASALTFTVPDAGTVITATLPVGGPIDVSAATLLTLIGPAVRGSERETFSDSIAPRVYETAVALDALRNGVLAGLLSSTFNPDPNRLPNGAAIEVVEDDGVTAFTVPTDPVIASAVLSGDLTLTGTGLANPETEEMIVSILNAGAKKLYQKAITDAGGTVSATSIVVPASLLNGVAVATSSVKVQFRSYMSNTIAVSLSP